MATGFTTIGHSNRGLDEFLQILRQAQAEALVDVRSFLRSRTNPVFDIEQLPGNLATKSTIGITRRLAGGDPGNGPSILGSTRCGEFQSFHNDADDALGNAFGDAFDEMVRLGHERRVALMCSEAVWWRCHRRIITDHLLCRREEVTHLMAIGKSAKATPTPGAQDLRASKVSYPAEASAGELETGEKLDHGFGGSPDASKFIRTHRPRAACLPPQLASLARVDGRRTQPACASAPRVLRNAVALEGPVLAGRVSDAALRSSRRSYR